MSNNIEENLKKNDIVLGVPPLPAAAYMPYIIQENIVYISGQLPMDEGKLMFEGRVPDEVSCDMAVQAARLCAVNIIKQIYQAIGQDWARFDRVIKLGGFVQSGGDFTDHPAIINGASLLMADIFGEKGQHARFAVGASSLPRNTPVEIDAIIAMKP